MRYLGKTVTKALALEAAQQRFGRDVEVFGHLNTIGRASNPYARDGEKEFHAIVRFKSRASNYDLDADQSHGTKRSRGVAACPSRHRQ